MSTPPIVIICGPTASGKSMLALELAEALNGEIVGADSMQVYIHMDIGTDKPSAEIRQRVAHHVIDLVYPDQFFDAAQYREEACQAIQTITHSGKTAFVVGGTGLYLHVLVHGLFTCLPIPEEVRMSLREEARECGPACLHEELRRVDSAAAERIHPHDTFRIVRALEVYRTVGKPISELQRAHRLSSEPVHVLKMAIDVERKDLYRRIEERVDRMMEGGLIEEVESLFNRGYDRSLRPMQSIGYRQIGAYLREELSMDRAIDLTKRDSRRYAKRQWTWFRGDSEVRWLAGRGLEVEALRMVKNHLKV